MVSRSGNWKKRESFRSALVQILAVGALLSAVVWFVYRSGVSRKALALQMKEARVESAVGNPANIRRAIDLAQQVLAEDPRATDAMAFLAATEFDLWNLYAEPGSNVKAASYLEQAKKAGAKTEEFYAAQAQSLLENKSFQEATVFVDELHQKGGTGPRLFLAQGVALKGLGQLRLSRVALHAATEIAWRDANFPCAEGEAMLEEGSAAALEVFRRTALAHPEHLRSQLGLALARVQKKEPPTEALSLVSQVLKREPELTPSLKARALAIRAGALNLQSQPGEALTVADQALVLRSDDPWALLFRAQALSLQKDAKSQSAWEAAIAQAPTAPNFYFQAASALQKLGAFEQALGVLTRYEEVFRNVTTPLSDGRNESHLERDDRYYLARGDLLRAAGKNADAIVAYDKAIAAKSSHLTQAVYAKAAVYLDQKQIDQARVLLSDITPNDGSGLSEAYLALGEILLSKKEFGPGCQNYAFALTKMKSEQQPRGVLESVLLEVEKKLKNANQTEMAKQWIQEAKPLLE
jgi:tetratricopeptide (TPR) repeat protein